jgi:hypothetical protein
MRTAVIYHGQARTFAECFANQYWYVLRKLPYPRFYVCVEDDDQAKDMDLLKKRFEHVHIRTFTKPETVKVFDVGLTSHSGSGFRVDPERLSRQWWARLQAWAMFHEMDAGRSDLIVLMRPDAFLRSIVIPNPAPRPDEIFTNWWTRSGGVNDRVAFAGPLAAHAVMTIYERMDEIIAMGCPLDGEPMIEAALELGRCRALPILKAWCTMRRLTGPSPGPEFSYDELVMAMHNQ